MQSLFWLDLTHHISGGQSPPGIWLFVVKLFVLMYLSLTLYGIWVVFNWEYGSEPTEAEQKITMGAMGFWTEFHFHKAFLIVLLAEAAIFQVFWFNITVISVTLTLYKT